MNHQFECAAVAQPDRREVANISRRAASDPEVFGGRDRQFAMARDVLATARMVLGFPRTPTRLWVPSPKYSGVS
jgi:hypothetical protein